MSTQGKRPAPAKRPARLRGSVGTLSTMGLSPVEERIYLALLRRKADTAIALCARTGLSRRAVGSALAALIQTHIDREMLSGQQGLVIPIVAMMGLAFLLSICSSVDAFVAASLGSALGLGPLVAFLAFGPVVNLKSMPLYARLFRVPAIAVVVIVAAEIVFIGALIAELRAW